VTKIIKKGKKNPEEKRDRIGEKGKGGIIQHCCSNIEEIEERSANLSRS